MTRVQIRAGTVYDPANNIDGVIRDVWIEAGRVIPTPPEGIRADRVIDASGLVVFPGGVDMHSHIAGPKVNHARKLLPEHRRQSTPIPWREGFRSGTIGTVPSTFATGYLYAGLGYTCAVDAAIPPLGARHAHDELHDTPQLDKAFLVLLGNNHFVMEQLAAGRADRVRDYVAWTLASTRGFGVKVVNPGGVEAWKSGARDVAGLEALVPRFGVTPRNILQGLARAIDELKLPHPLHIHANRLGIPGNWQTTLETMRAMDGQRAHFAHIQFHSYGGDPDDPASFCSQAGPLIDYINEHPNLSVDIGQILFGQTTSMTGDGPLGYYLHRVLGNKWFSSDLEHEGGCGIVPIRYQHKSLIHAVQWAIGLEWYLRLSDPWRVAMTTDHPNGATFLAYPHLIALLMNRLLRQDLLATMPPGVAERTSLPDLDREYTLREIAIITRAAPARLLGLAQKGHLGPGADGDVVLYQPSADIEQMFRLPRYVLKRGEVLVDDAEMVRSVAGHTYHVAPGYDDALTPELEQFFAANYSMSLANYPLIDAETDRLCLVTPG